MHSAKATMADRGTALAAVQAARGEVAAKRSKLSKLRGTPGIRVPPSRCAKACFRRDFQLHSRATCFQQC